MIHQFCVGHSRHQESNIPPTFAIQAVKVIVYNVGGRFLFVLEGLFVLGHMVSHVGSYSSPTGMEPMPPAVEAQSFNHRTTREVPVNNVILCVL